MKRIAVALASMSLSAGMAWGQETFLLGLTGSGRHLPLPSECQPQPFCPPTQVDWTGTMRIVTGSAADGVYTGDSLLALDFTSNVLNFNLDAIRASSAIFGPPDYSVTLAGNQVVSVDFSVHLTPGANLPAPTVVTFSRLSGQFDVPISHSVGSTSYSGTLAAIPEPASSALLLAGLAGLVALASPRRRERRCHVFQTLARE